MRLGESHARTFKYICLLQCSNYLVITSTFWFFHLSFGKRWNLARSVCGSPKQVETPKFQSSPSKDEPLLAIARLHGYKLVNRGTLYGSYSFRGQEYWSAKFDMRDGYSGSPVYNERAEVIGVFSGYDWNQRLAVISPANRAEKLLEDYFARRKQ